MKTTFEFLEQDVYLPGYMFLTNPNYGKDWATFDFNVKEPPVARENLVDYFTPRGLHICVSQGGIAMVENMISEGLLEYESLPLFRNVLLQGRLKMVELYQKFRKELKTSNPIPGRIMLEKVRMGKIPLLRMGFDLGNRAVEGHLVSVIAPQSLPQLNADLLRFKND